MLYFVSRVHSSFSLNEIILICDNGALGSDNPKTSTNPQSSNNPVIVFRLSISFWDRFVALPSKANSSLK